MPARRTALTDRTVTLLVNPVNEEFGTVTPVGQFTYRKGSKVTLTATSKRPFGFTHWYDGTEDIPQNPLEVTLNEDKVFTAYFGYVGE